MRNINFISREDIDPNIIQNQTSTVGEPSVAKIPGLSMFTANWFAAIREDGGTWQYKSPFTTFPAPQNDFCCDQTVLTDKNHSHIFWLLQYQKGESKVTGRITNTLRIAINTDLEGDFLWYDLVPEEVNENWKGLWFDYNHAVVSDNYLYVGTNVFRGDNFSRSVVFKIALEDILNTFSYSYFETTEFGSLRCTQGAQDIMYIATHDSPSKNNLIVFKWDEFTDTIDQMQVPISSYSRFGHTSLLSDGTDWLSRCDRRITGAWYSNGMIGFMWAAHGGSSGPKSEPYIRVVRIDTSTPTLTLIDEPDIWSNKYAFAYPEVCPNNEGDIGVTMFVGGGSLFPSHVVGFWDNDRWRLFSSSRGTDGPDQNKWGDYLGCRLNPDGRSWSASGYVLEGGQTRNFIVPKYVEFEIEQNLQMSQEPLT